MLAVLLNKDTKILVGTGCMNISTNLELIALAQGSFQISTQPIGEGVFPTYPPIAAVEPRILYPPSTTAVPDYGSTAALLILACTALVLFARRIPRDA